jgi:hypothetical protein
MEIKKLFDYSQPLVAATTLFIVALFIMALYASYVVYDIKLASDTIEVTGSAKEAVVADTGRWTIMLETRTGVTDQQAGFTRLEAGVEKITAFLETQGFTEYETPAGTTYPTYTYPQYSEPIQTGYSVSRNVVVRSSDVAKLSELANEIQPLIGTGYNVSTGSLELTYSKLDEMRVALLTKAIADATNRANAIAQNSGRSVRLLRNAVGGVVQVLPQGGVEISDYGMYDTQSMNKEVMVTVRATFGLK